METSPSGAGGKIVTDRRRQRITASPYHRPPQPSPLESPSWFSGVIVPSARAIASSAGKILSSIFSESESSSSDEDDYASEDDIIDDNLPEIPCNQEIPLDEKNVSFSEAMMQFRQESQLSVWKSETKMIIEQLIMKETFSREEYDRLMKVLNSRVVDGSMDLGEKSSVTGSPWNRLDHVLQEAKRWFQEKKPGSRATESTVCSPSTKTDSSHFTVARIRMGSDRAGEEVFVAGERLVEPLAITLYRPIDVLAEAECSVPKLIHKSSPEHAEEPHSGLHLCMINSSPASKATSIVVRESANDLLSSHQVSLSRSVAEYDNQIEYHASNVNSNNMEGNCELLTEAYMESGSLVQYEEKPPVLALPSVRQKHDITSGNRKQQGRKATRFSRRRRGRGKQTASYGGQGALAH